MVNLFLFSCKKSTPVTPLTTNTFIKVIPADTNYSAGGCIILSDGDYLIYSYNTDFYAAPIMTKMSTAGQILWQKYFPISQIDLWKVLPMTGGGFISAGLNFNLASYTANTLSLCTFDPNGNVTNSKNLPAANNSVSFIQTDNGNYALCSYDSVVYLDIVDANLNLLNHNELVSFDFYGTQYLPSRIPFYLCQNNTGGFEIASYGSFAYAYFGDPYGRALCFIRTDRSGKMLYFNHYHKKDIFETPYGILNDANGNLLMAESYFTYVNVDLYPELFQRDIFYWGGTLGIDKRDSLGKEINRIDFSGYSQQGVINSIHPTKDGGYIICGTVGMGVNADVESVTSIYLRKVDANLNTVFAVTIPSTYPTYGAEGIETADGGYLVAGYCIYSAANKIEAIVYKTDANGKIAIQ